MGFLTNKYTLVAIFYLTSLAACGWLSYDYASTKVKFKWEQERVEVREATITAMSILNKKNTELSSRLTELEVQTLRKVESVEVKTVEVEKEGIKYVQKYVTGSCPGDGDRLRIKNTAIATTSEFAR